MALPTALDPAILAMVQADVTTFLTDTCTVSRAASTVDDFGGVVETFQTVVSNAPCRIILSTSRSGAQNQVVGNAETLRQMYRLVVKKTVALGVNYRVTDSSGNVYDVVQVETALTDEVMHTAIIVRRT